MTTEEKKTRRRYTDAEKMERIRSQEAMILKRAKDKQRERVTEALMLLDGVEGHQSVAARASLTNWLQENVP